MKRTVTVWPAIAVGLLMWSWAGAGRAWADRVEVSAKVDRPRIAQGDTVQLTVTVTVTKNLDSRALGGRFMGHGYDQYIRPSMPDFDILSKSQSNSTQAIFGGRTARLVTEYVFTYLLQPRKTGRLKIGSARVRVGGRIYSSLPVFVQVVPGAGGSAGRVSPGAPPSGGPAVPPPPPSGPGTDRDAYVAAQVDKRECFVGQQVTVTWLLYHSAPLRSLTPVRMPDTPYALIEDIYQIGPQTRTRQQVVGGRAYFVTPLYKKAFFPTQPGTLKIGSLAVEVGFSVWAAGPATRTLSSAPVEIAVRPLPSQGRPKEYPTRPGANVGTYTFSVTADWTKVKTGDAVTVVVKASGVGHPNLLVLPKIPEISGFKVRRGKPQVDVKPGDSVAGSKSVEYVLIATKPGSYTIPALALHYFDPHDRSYRTVRSKPIRLVVTGRPLVEGSKGGANVLTRGIRPIHRDVHLVNRLGPTFYRTRLFWALWLLPLLVLGVLAGGDQLRKRLSKDTEAKRRRRVAGQVRRRLKTARQLLKQEDAPAFFAELTRVLNEMVGERFSLKVSGLTFDELERKMKDAGADPRLVEDVVGELRACDFARFSSAAASKEEMERALERVRGLVSRLSSVRRKTGGAGS